MPVHSKSSRVLVATGHLSGSITGYTITHTRAMGETTTLMDEGSRFIPGLLEGSLNLSGLFDSAAGGIHELIDAARQNGTELLVTVLPDGLAVGQPAFIATSELTSYNAEAAVAETVTIEVEGTPDDGVDWGVSLHAHAAETATGNGASIDNAASTANGGVASLHVTAATGTSPSMTAKVQHSVDGTVWVDLITFTAATGAASERKTVTGTVNRYVRESRTISGTSPNFTFAMAFARR
jgi:hypothetical protein